MPSTRVATAASRGRSVKPMAPALAWVASARHATAASAGSAPSSRMGPCAGRSRSAAIPKGRLPGLFVAATARVPTPIATPVEKTACPAVPHILAPRCPAVVRTTGGAQPENFATAAPPEPVGIVGVITTAAAHNLRLRGRRSVAPVRNRPRQLVAGVDGAAAWARSVRGAVTGQRGCISLPDIATVPRPCADRARRPRQRGSDCHSTRTLQRPGAAGRPGNSRCLTRFGRMIGPAQGDGPLRFARTTPTASMLISNFCVGTRR